MSLATRGNSIHPVRHRRPGDGPIVIALEVLVFEVRSLREVHGHEPIGVCGVVLINGELGCVVRGPAAELGDAAVEPEGLVVVRGGVVEIEC